MKSSPAKSDKPSSPAFHRLFSLGGAGLGAPGAGTLTREQQALIVIFLVFPILAFTQNFIGILLANYSPQATLIVLGIKEVYVFAMVGIGLLAWLIRRSFPPYFLPMVIAIGLITAYIPISPFFNVRQYRALLTLPILFLFGILFSSRLRPSHVQTGIIVLLVLLTASGYIERFALYTPDEAFLGGLGSQAFFHIKDPQLPLNGPGGLVRGGFYSWDLLPIAGDRVRRMISLLMVDPTLFGQAIVLPIIYYGLKKQWAWVAFFGVAVIATISKGGLLTVFIAAALAFYWKTTNKAARVAIVAVVVAAVLGILVGALAHTQSIENHLGGLVGGFRNMLQKPIGGGIGAGGNLARRIFREQRVTSDIDFEDLGAESYIGAAMTQLGVVAFVLYVGAGVMIWRLKINLNNPWHLAIKATAIATLVAACGAESAVSFVGTGYVFALVGLLMGSLQLRGPAAPSVRRSPPRQTAVVTPVQLTDLT